MKAWYQSKTVWFNVLFGLVSLASLFGYADFTPDPNVATGVALLGAVVNFVLRIWFTSGPVGLRDSRRG